MKFKRAALVILSAAFLSSCSCAIYNEGWKNTSKRKRISESMVSGAMMDQDFRQTKSASGSLHFEGHNSSVGFFPKSQAIVFHSSFCPLPWEIIMDRGSFGEMERLKAHLLSEFKRQGIQMQQLRPSELGYLDRQDESAR